MPYKNGYSTLPDLKPLDGPPFNAPHLVPLKREVRRQVFFEHKIDHSIYEPICRYIRQQTSLQGDFQELAWQIGEDLAIHRVQDGKDWLAATHVCFPSGWRPEDKIGLPLKEIHRPIPGMNLNNSFKLATAMVNNGPFQRFVWSVVTENKISFHPDEINKPFDGQLFVKVERQITIPFPEIQAGLFILRQNILLPEEIDYTALRNACAGMTDAQREYKGISGEMMDWLIFVPRGETAIIIRS